MVAQDALERRADPEQRRARRHVPSVGLEFDPLCIEGLERVRELEELRLAIGAGPLEGSTEPCPADLESSMLTAAATGRVSGSCTCRAVDGNVCVIGAGISGLTAGKALGDFRLLVSRAILPDLIAACAPGPELSTRPRR